MTAGGGAWLFDSVHSRWKFARARITKGTVRIARRHHWLRTIPRGLAAGGLAAAVVFAVATGIVGAADTAGLSYLAGSLPKDEPQAVYADDPTDSWNRILHYLFTRKLNVRLSEDFPEGAPFTSNEVPATNEVSVFTMGKSLSTRLFERIELGDRAIEPLYPHELFRPDISAAQLLAEPRFQEFEKALSDALAETVSRPPLDQEAHWLSCEQFRMTRWVASAVGGWRVGRGNSAFALQAFICRTAP